jgi:hypothetical protein
MSFSPSDVGNFYVFKEYNKNGDIILMRDTQVPDYFCLTNEE